MKHIKLLMYGLLVVCVIHVSTTCAMFPMFINFARNTSARVAQNNPSSFGITHFIVGHRETFDQKLPAEKNQPRNVYPRALFSRNQKLLPTLLNLINNESTSIKVAMFSMTDKDIAQALINAHKRNVHVECVMDATGIRDRASKMSELCNNHVPVHIFNPHKNAYHKPGRTTGIMHHKFMIFGNNNQPILWTGSFNCTCAAHKTNRENVILLTDEDIIKDYRDEFNKLKEESNLLVCNKDQKTKER